jgi:uncharacterized protein YdiU (UPF0061 family)
MLTRLDHSDPTGLYSYRNQPSRVLFALDKLVSALSPVIGYEATHGKPIQDCWHEGASKEDVAAWDGKAREVFKGWEEEFWCIERETERAGWLKVSPSLVVLTQQRFGLKTYKPSDDRDVIYDYLVLLHDNSMDLNASFRTLSSFLPSQVSDECYLASFLSDFTSSSILSPKGDDLERAKNASKGWLLRFAERVSAEEEKAAWSEAWLEEDHKRFGPSDIAMESWESKRREGMRRTNPRFVLRQWVLEELIAELTAMGVGDESRTEEAMVEARKRLARILDVSLPSLIEDSAQGVDVK